MRLLVVCVVAGLGVYVLSSRAYSQEIPDALMRFGFEQRIASTAHEMQQGDTKPVEQTVRGKAVDKDNHPVTNKQLRFEGKGKTYSVYTDGTGSFTFVGAPGNYEVSAVGSTGKKANAKIEDNRLIPNPLVLDLE